MQHENCSSCSPKASTLNLYLLILKPQNIENRIDTYEGVGSIQLKLKRSIGFFGEVLVSWQATPREADTDDFSPSGGTVLFKEGQLEAYIDISIVDDEVPEDLQVGIDSL